VTEPPGPGTIPGTQQLALTRELLRGDALDRMLAQRAPAIRLLTREERDRSLRDTLAARPAGERDGAWLFAYGSLIWNPTVEYVERRVATVQGWHRAFCLSTLAGRGTPDNPGLVLGLDSGGRCDGAAFRIAEDVLEAELRLLWQREMLSGSYVPRWLPVLGADGAAFGSAIAFTIDPRCDFYAGNLPEAEVVRRLATAQGELGSAAEYLFRTRDGLRALRLHDALVEHLAAQVDAHGDARAPSPPQPPEP
jgi:glutathione-specific gamma-glutamylcyclotransferase